MYVLHRCTSRGPEQKRLLHDEPFQRHPELTTLATLLHVTSLRPPHPLWLHVPCRLALPKWMVVVKLKALMLYKYPWKDMCR